MNDDDNRDRPRMVDDDAIDSQALTGADVTRYRALVAGVSYLSQDRPDLKFAACRYAVRWPSPQCVTRNVSRGSEETSLADREQSAGSAGSKVGNWRRIQTRTGEETRPLGDQSQAGSS